MQHNGYLMAYQMKHHSMNTMEIEERHLERSAAGEGPWSLSPIPSIRTLILSLSLSLILFFLTHKKVQPRLRYFFLLFGAVCCNLSPCLLLQSTDLLRRPFQPVSLRLKMPSLLNLL